MRTNIEIDDDLMAKALKVSNIKTKRGVIEKALELFVRLENQKQIMALRGKIKFFDDI